MRVGGDPTLVGVQLNPHQPDRAKAKKALTAVPAD